jgi:hypothetical protein
MRLTSFFVWLHSFIAGVQFLVWFLRFVFNVLMTALLEFAKWWQTFLSMANWEQGSGDF